MSDEIKKFCLVGIVTCPEFQKCRCYLRSLHKSFPKIYRRPDIRPMLNLEWNEYLTKMRRKVGGKMWCLKSDLVVLLDDEVLGGDVELLNYLSSKFKLSINRDFHKLGVFHLREILQQTVEAGRRFVYMTVAVDFKVIGTILILLYADLVPNTVRYFLKCCKHWATTKIHRIVQRCWIQGIMIRKPHRRPCENYIVPHDRRGVLSTCNSAKHTDNTCQFHISLNPTPWMDYKYVAFGQVIHGDEVLTFIENVPTCYEKPTKDIEITACGEFILDEDVDAKTIRDLEMFLSITDQIGRMVTVEDVRDVPSELSITKYMQGLYAFPTDTIPYMLISKYLRTIYEEFEKEPVEEEQDEEEEEEEEEEEGSKVLKHVTEVKDVDRAAFLSRKDLRFKSDIYRKSSVASGFRIQDTSPYRRRSGVEQSLSHAAVIPASLHTRSVQMEITENQNQEVTENQPNSLYLV